MGIKENMLPVTGSVGDGDKIRVVTSEGESRTIEFSDFSDAMPKPTGEIEITENGITDVTQYATANVNVSGGGTSSKSRKDINFFDYDGTIVESYTTAEWANVSALPSNPTHDGLTAQGWNYTKAEVDAEVTAQGKCDVGQMYITTSGATEIDIELHEGRLSPYLGICPNGTVEIDWGDGSAHDTVTGTSLTTIKSTLHNYASAGKYTIKLTVRSGEFAIAGASGYTGLLWKNNTVTPNGNRVYGNAIQAIRLGENMSIGEYAFYTCYSLTSITIPSGVTSIGRNAFTHCYRLASITIPSGVTSVNASATLSRYFASITIPSGVTSIGNSAFSSCYRSASITIPSGVTSIGNSAFSTCYSLTSITIPSGVTSIGDNVFANCYGMARYYFLPTTPPTIATNTFSNIPSDCVIYVPAESVEAYKTATNWSTYASHIQAMPE